MGTKIVELAVKCVEQVVKEPKPISFILVLGAVIGGGRVASAVLSPKNWDCLALLSKGGENKYDTIVAWNEDENEKFVYLGFWNDGIVG